MSTIEERIAGYLSAMASFVEAASKAKDSNTSVLSLSKALQGVTKALSTSDHLSLSAALQGHKDSAEVLQGIAGLSTYLTSLTGADRTEGDDMAKKLTMAVESGLLEGDDRDKADDLLKRWRESAPKGGASSGSGGGSSKPAGRALPFPVKVTCEADGWSARQTGNVNSLRWAAILHHGEKHGGKPAKGDAVHTGLTEAILSVCDEKSASAQGGGYLVDRTA